MDHKKISSLFDKKKKSSEGLSDVEKRAKTGVLKDLQSRASKAMGSKLRGLSSQKPVEEKNAEDGHSSLMGKGTLESVLEDSMPHSSPGDSTKHMAESEHEVSDGDEAPMSHGEEGLGSEVAHGVGEHDLHKPLEHMSEDEVDHHLQRLMAHKHSLKK